MEHNCIFWFVCSVRSVLCVVGPLDWPIGNNSFAIESKFLIECIKFQKRVNTLTKKFEWDYFEALTTQKLPKIEEKVHRKKVGDWQFAC